MGCVAREHRDHCLNRLRRLLQIDKVRRAHRLTHPVCDRVGRDGKADVV